MCLFYNYCYHGTTRDNMKKIISEEKFTYYERDDHWLGNGVYFFLEDKEKAKWFTTCDRRNKNKKKCIISVELEIKTEELLNLDIEIGRNKFNTFIKEFKETNPEMKSDFRSQNNYNCFFIDLFTRIYPEYKAIKYTFHDDKIKYPYIEQKKDKNNVNTVISNNAIQVCVKNQSIINFGKLSVENI